VAYYFLLDGVPLPVTPFKLETKISNKNKTITLINDGEINILKTPGLTEFSFEALLPQSEYPFATYWGGFKPAAYYADKIESLKVNNQKFQFKVMRIAPNGSALFDTNIKVTIEEYGIIEDTKNGLDLIVNIKLKQYREYGTKVGVVKPATATTPATIAVSIEREVSKVAPKTHTVVSGDSLWKICKKLLGDGSKYSEIATLNGIANANLISVGQVINLG
jgi:LysM repeat protein